MIIPLADDVSAESLRGASAEEISERLVAAALAAYDAKEQTVGSETMRELERIILLQTLDRKWIDHLYAMDALREGIGLRAYGQVNPLMEYQKEGYALFGQMKQDVQEETVRFLYLVQVQPLPAAARTGEAPAAAPLRGLERPAYRVTGERGAGDAERPRPARGGGGTATQLHVAKVGRNDPCPCGSGKKYKKCHGRGE